jgi:hypothetical protein
MDKINVPDLEVHPTFLPSGSVLPRVRREGDNFPSGDQEGRRSPPAPEERLPPRIPYCPKTDSEQCRRLVLAGAKPIRQFTHPLFL